MVPPLVHAGLKTSLIFSQNLPIQTAHHTFVESRHPEVTKNLYDVLFTRQSKIPIFWTPAHGLFINQSHPNDQKNNMHENLKDTVIKHMAKNLKSIHTFRQTCSRFRYKQN